MILPSLTAIIAPVATGLLLGVVVKFGPLVSNWLGMGK
jgi:Na+/H+-translocating membrane pyrophosphatase